MRDDRGRRPQRGFFGLWMLLIMMSVPTLGAFLLLKPLYKPTMATSPLLLHLLTTYASIGLTYFSFRLIFWTVHRWAHMHKRNAYERLPRVMSDAMDALDRISHGDFDVLLEEDADDHGTGLSARINSMAESLRSMEHMRQDFVSNVSHEIQSPLTSIAGFATLLKQEGLSDEQRLHYIEIIETESKRLSKLSDNLLRLSLLDSDHGATPAIAFRLDQQLEDTLLLLEPQWMEKNITPDLDLEKLEITGDMDLLSQVWSNLLHNAIKFTPEGGTISVRLTCEDDAAVCTITDTGIGIPKENLIHIFERFYKVDKARDRSLGGNGLGLSLVKRIVECHGGQVSVRSEEGEGSTFAVTLPIQKG